MSILKDLEWCKRKVREHLVECRNIPPWELDIKPTRVWKDADGKGLNKEWRQFKEVWTYWEPLP